VSAPLFRAECFQPETVCPSLNQKGKTRPRRIAETATHSLPRSYLLKPVHSILFPAKMSKAYRDEFALVRVGYPPRWVAALRAIVFLGVSAQSLNDSLDPSKYVFCA